MSNDLKELKTKILEDEKVSDLLEKLGCENITPKHNRYEAQLPSKFGSNNNRSVQVYLNETLSCKIRTRSVSGIDIFGLVAILKFDSSRDEVELRRLLSKSKRWICEQLGYQCFLQGNFAAEERDEPLKWLKELHNKRKKPKFEVQENRIYDDIILNQYVMYPHMLYIEEGVSYKTQVEFEIGFDISSNRIIFPMRNKYGELISVKGRTCDPDYKKKDIYKFVYLYNFNKIIELYNWHKALYYILEKKEIVIYEGEKTCWLSTQFDVRNCVAISGDDLSTFQVDMIKSLGMDINIVIGLDKDKEPADFIKQAKKFGFSRNVYALWDGRKVFSKEQKHSPTDLGQEAFMGLYNDRHKYRII